MYLPFREGQALHLLQLYQTIRVSLKHCFNFILVHHSKRSSLLSCFCRGNLCSSYRGAATQESIPREAAHQLNVFRHSHDLAHMFVAQPHVLRPPC